VRVAGVMSGTSLDGIDVAIIDIKGRNKQLRFTPVAFHTVPYAPNVRSALAGVSNTMTHAGAISRLNFLLGELYAEAIFETCRRKRVRLRTLDLCGLHGQTIYHEGAPVEYLGHQVASTLQIGEAAVVAERTGLRVISNFRERDIAAGGAGAPLVPFVDFLLFRNRYKRRAVVNIGGIANISLLPPGADPQKIVAFDTGPGNMVIDALVTHLTGGRETFDRGGKLARSGNVHRELLLAMRDDPYFKLPPPKTAGREQFGPQFASGLVATGIPLPDLIATATDLTANTIAGAILHNTVDRDVEIVVSGGGVHNRFLMDRLRYYAKPWKVSSSAEFGINPDAKEAIAFAVLAYESYNRRPSNVPSATGARRAVVLGKEIVRSPAF
jgi:anhydro-N-acetylmuramic acid kinase